MSDRAAGTVDQAARSAPVPTERIGGLHVSAVVFFVVGLIVVVALAGLAWSSHQASEDRILERRAREAAAVLNAASSNLSEPLTAAAEILDATGEDLMDFATFVRPTVADGGSFYSVSVWRVGSDRAAMEAVVGEEPALAGDPTRAASELTGIDGPHLIGLLDASPPILAAAVPVAGSDLVVYAETAVPGAGAAVDQPGPAFADLRYALYLGEEAPARLIFANAEDLPLRGRRAEATIELGDATMVLIVSPTGLVGSSLSAILPWAIVGSGVLLAAGFAGLNERALRRRDEAAALATEVARIAQENARLYSEQRSVAQTLQQSLLIDQVPQVEGVQVAARYQAGSDGVDIGGDWYDVIRRREDCLLLVVGDVSGRGIRAATVMAKLRYSIRAYAAQDDGVDQILAKCSRLASVEGDGHFATVLLVEVDPTRRTTAMVSAGHPPPILLHDGEASLLEIPRGVPVGVADEPTYDVSEQTLPPGSTLLGYTDGLFERRGETVDDGLERLRRAVEAAPGASVEGLLDALVAHLAETSTDDAAILAVRWPPTTNPS